MVSNLALFGNCFGYFSKIGHFFPNHLVTLLKSNPKKFVRIFVSSRPKISCRKKSFKVICSWETLDEVALTEGN